MQTGHKKIRFKVNINYIKQKYYYYKAIKLDINKYVAGFLGLDIRDKN